MTETRETVEVWMCECCGKAALERLWDLDYCEKCYVVHYYDVPLFVGNWDEVDARWEEICAERYPSLAAPTDAVADSEDVGSGAGSGGEQQ